MSYGEYHWSASDISKLSQRLDATREESALWFRLEKNQHHLLLTQSMQHKHLLHVHIVSRATLYVCKQYLSSREMLLQVGNKSTEDGERGMIKLEYLKVELVLV